MLAAYQKARAIANVHASSITNTLWLQTQLCSSATPDTFLAAKPAWRKFPGLAHLLGRQKHPSWCLQKRESRSEQEQSAGYTCMQVLTESAAVCVCPIS